MNKKTQDVMFSSVNMEEETPQDFFDQLNVEFQFSWDLAASPTNNKTPDYFDDDQDSLLQDWNGLGMCWCNPPYGRGIKGWVMKAEHEAEKGASIVMLLPARTDTKWFEIIADTADEIRFVKGRLKFGDNNNSAPFPSMIAIWYGDHNIRMYPPPKGAYEWNLIWKR